MSEPHCQATVSLRFFLPPEPLRPFITTLYHSEVRGTRGVPVEDWLHPEWANLRLFSAAVVEAAVGDAQPQLMPRVVLAGPTSQTTRFRTGDGRFWGIGILPMGWARLVNAPAHLYADRLCSALHDPALAELAELRSGLFGQPADLEAEYDRLCANLVKLTQGRGEREEEILAVQAALLDPSLHSVTELAARVGMNARTLERFARVAFGFTPQTLLRRQRFLRSLARFMLDPTLSWIDTLDSHYHDQAHFVRDFRRFMTMKPSAYASLPHPVLIAAARARMEIAGEAVQGLHRPIAP